MAVKAHVPTDSERAFFHKANELSKQAEPVPWYKSIPSAALKGLINGTAQLGQIMSGTHGQNQETDENRQIVLDEALRSNQGLGEKIAERSGELLPSLAGGGTAPLSSVIRAVGAGASSGLAKELGGGDVTQALAELPALLGPDLAKKIPTRAGSKQEKLAGFARENAVPEKDLGLMLGDQGAIKERLTHIAPKGGTTEKAFGSAKESLNRLWSNIRSSPEAQNALNKEQSESLIQGLLNKIEGMPSEQYERVSGDIIDLLKSPMKGDDIINFWQDLNYYIPKGEKGLGLFKEELSKSLNQISPKLGEEFSMLNDLYGNYSRLHQQMKPSLVDQFFRAGEIGALAYGAISMDIPTLAAVVGPVAARELARRAIISPRLQNLSQRFVNASQRSSPALAKKAYDQFILEIAKEDAETAAKLSEFDAEEFSKALTGKKHE